MTQESPPATSTPPPMDTSLASIGRSTIVNLVIATLLFGAISLIFRDPLESAGRWFVQSFGLGGTFLGVFVSDAFFIPIALDVYVLASVVGKADLLLSLAVISLGSVLGGNVAFFVGRLADRWPWLNQKLKSSAGQALFARWGMTAVALAAWTPLPFSYTCALAGAFHMDYKRFFLATLHRVPRAAAAYGLIMAGWLATE